MLLSKTANKCIWGILALLVLISCKDKTQIAQKTQITKDYTQYVNPFIGTSENGHCFPGATVPFGMIQASPATGNCSWRYCSGYQYEDEVISGFAQTHINGTGCGDLGDILLLPFTNRQNADSFSARIDKKQETASPGYYQVNLLDEGVNVELTCSEHVALHKYSYTKKGVPQLLIDLQYGIVGDTTSLQKHILEFDSTIENNNLITGFVRASHWVDRKYFFVIEFNKPFLRKTVLPQKSKEEKAGRYVLDFDLSGNEILLTKIALSTVSIENAKMNMAVEIPDWNFENVRSKANAKWNQVLSRIDIEASGEEKENFYTSLYHLFLQPANIADVNGDYRGANDKVSNSSSKAYYSTFSLWDTYRAAHPLYTLISPGYVNDFVNSMLLHHDAQGYLPIWTLWGKENHTMIGNHSVPVIVDAYLKGFNGFDAEKAFDAIRSSLRNNHFKSSWDIYDKYGYYPFDLVSVESVSRTLESVYDDYCASIMAQKLGKEEDCVFFTRRSDYYKNLFDPSTSIMRPKNSGGEWKSPFYPLANAHDGTIGGDYTEGNAWQYTWHVQHDIQGLIDLMGGNENFIGMLDSLFTMKVEGQGHVLDITGLIGQYAHGNEPSHHVSYLYSIAGKPSRTQELVREIVKTQYGNYPAGLCGNDDCGQMSAWYIFSCMGFYPVNPCGGEYILGAPQLPKIRLNLPDGNHFTIIAKNLSDENKYVQQVLLNNLIFSDKSISHGTILKGGELLFVMGNTPVD